MGYPENTAVSGVGQRILNDIFDLIYLQSDAPTNQIARMINNRSQIKEVVTNFKENAPRIVTLMKRFMKGNTHVPRDDAGDSGLFVCNPLWLGFGGNTEAPDSSELGCGRRDHLWWWEFLDFGVYNSYTEWGSSIGLTPWPHNYVDQTWDRAQMVVARVRCNTVMTCDGQSGGCGTTWNGGPSSRCPNPNCENSQGKQVGCGKTSYAMFHIKTDKPVSSYWKFTSGNFRNGAPIPGAAAELPKKTLSIMKGNAAADDSNSVPAFYRFFWQGLPPINTYLSTFDQCMSHIPYLQMGYRSTNDASKTRPGGYKCNECGVTRLAPPYDENQPNPWNVEFDIHPRKTNFTTDNYPGDQHGGLCKNIGDVAGSYAGLAGNFGCLCGGTYEPVFKVPAINAQDYQIAQEMVQAGRDAINAQTTSNYVRTTAPTAGSGERSNQSIYGRGAKDTSREDAVFRRYGEARVLEATENVKKVKEMQIMRAGNAYPFTVPISKMRYAFTNTPLRICTAPNHRGVEWVNPSTGQREKGSPFQPLLDRNGNAMDYCPQCGINGNAQYITTHPERWLNPARPYTITTAQPLTDQNTIGILGRGADGRPVVQKQTFLERPQWTIVMRDLTDDQERYNLRLELPQAYLGDVIPTKFTPQPPPPTSDNRPEGHTCPNERQGPLAEEMTWLMENYQGDPNLAPSEESLEDDELLVEETVRAGDDTLKVSPVVRVNVGDFISGGPYSNGTRITAINNSNITVTPAAQSTRGSGFNPDGSPVMTTEFAAPFTIKFLANTNSDNPLTPDCCDGVQAPQYTFLVTEGKSASAFYSRVERDWVDTSPLVQYGNGEKGLRWTEVNVDAAEETTAIHTQNDIMGTRFPNQIDASVYADLVAADELDADEYQLPNPVKYGAEYQWCDLDADQQNQMVQDMFANANRMLRSVLSNTGGGGSNWKIEGNHSHFLAEEQEVAQSGVVQKHFKCQTCEALAAIGLSATQRGMATNLLDALENNTYYPGYSTIRYYQRTGDLDRDSNIIQSDGTVDLIPLPAGTLTKGYLEGAFKWETTGRDGVAAGWYNWAIRHLQDLAEGGDYRLG